MTVQAIPNIEAVLFSYLDAHPDLTALDCRIGGRLPGKESEQVKRWVVVTQLDASDVGGVEHLIDYLVQFDCYAGLTAQQNEVGQGDASLLARTLRAVLTGMRGQTVDGAVVTGTTVQGMARVPDPDFKPARERFVLTVAIHAHG